jgi:hypothetical protein
VLEVHREAGLLDASIVEAAVLDAPFMETSLPRESSVVDAQAVGACRIQGAADGFYESFPDGPLDPARWLVAEGDGFARANVSIAQSLLVLDVGPSSAAAIATVDLFASATYQVQARISDGVQLALWWRRDDDADGTLELTSPGQDYAHVLMHSSDGTAASENQFALTAALNDGKDHILRFDRYTTASPAATFWVDDEMRWSTRTHLPSTRAGRMWIVARGSGRITVSNAFVTPFGNDGDRCSDGELRGAGLVRP